MYPCYMLHKLPSSRSPQGYGRYYLYSRSFQTSPELRCMSTPSQAYHRKICKWHQFNKVNNPTWRLFYSEDILLFTVHQNYTPWINNNTSGLKRADPTHLTVDKMDDVITLHIKFILRVFRKRVVYLTQLFFRNIDVQHNEVLYKETQ